MELRDYQRRACEEIRAAWRESPLLCIPTGGGKTVVAADFISGCIAKGGRALLIVHSRDLVHQTARRFRAQGLTVGVLMGREHPGDAPVVCATIQTLARRELPVAKVVIIDEAHRAASESYQDVIAEYRARDAVIIGLTATPARLDGRGLGSVGFGRIVDPITYEELFAAGHLLKPRPYAPSDLNIANLKVRAGEFVMPDKAIVGDLVEHYKKISPGTLAVAFGCTVDHSKAIAEAFNAGGIPAGHLDGASCTEERDDMLSALAARDILVLSNCALFGEGWDMPQLETCIMARPTMSMTIFRQQAGRIMRPYPGKREPILLDHVANIRRHGMPWDRIVWSLDSRPPKESANAQVKRCPKCFAMVPTQTRTCHCGYEFPFADASRVPASVDGELVDVSQVDARKVWYLDLVRTAWAAQYRVGWARNKYRERFNEWPPVRFTKAEKEHYPCVEHEAESFTGRWGTKYRCRKCLREARPVRDLG